MDRSRGGPPVRVRRVRIPDLRAGARTLRGPEAHHLARVVRVASGDPVEAFDGRGARANGRVVAVTADAVELHLEAPEANPADAAPDVTAWVALLKGDALASVVRQGTELGVARFAPFRAARSERPTLSPAKASRYRRVAAEAAKQSGRAHVPDVADVAGLDDVAPAAAEVGATVWVADPDGDVPAHAAVADWRAAGSSPLAVVTGPEGGLTAAEVDALAAEGARRVRFGPRILRAETAPVAFAALALAEGAS